METSAYSDYSNQGFKLEFKKDGVKTYAMINTEMYSEEDGLDFTGNYQVYMLDPSVGSINFKIAKRDDQWELVEGPEYVKPVIDYIGHHIDKTTRQL